MTAAKPDILDQRDHGDLRFVRRRKADKPCVVFVSSDDLSNHGNLCRTGFSCDLETGNSYAGTGSAAVHNAPHAFEHYLFLLRRHCDDLRLRLLIRMAAARRNVGRGTLLADSGDRLKFFEKMRYVHPAFYTDARNGSEHRDRCNNYGVLADRSIDRPDITPPALTLFDD